MRASLAVHIHTAASPRVEGFQNLSPPLSSMRASLAVCMHLRASIEGEGISPFSPLLREYNIRWRGNLIFSSLSLEVHMQDFPLLKERGFHNFPLS